jgi:hypothetical protein
MGLHRIFLTIVCLSFLCRPGLAQVAPSFPAGTVFPKIVGRADSQQSHALYPPSGFRPRGSGR